MQCFTSNNLYRSNSCPGYIPFLTSHKISEESFGSFRFGKFDASFRFCNPQRLNRRQDAYEVGIFIGFLLYRTEIGLYLYHFLTDSDPTGIPFGSKSIEKW